MAVTAYKSSTTRRIFTNQPFKRGMLYEDITTNEGMSKSIVNLDISSNGEYAYPRPAFVSAVMDNFYQIIEDFPTNIIKQMTSLDKTFLIGFEKTVSEEDFLNGTVSSEASLTKPLGLNIISVGRGFEERERRDGIFEIIRVDNVFDGDTFEVDIINEEDKEETIRIRLLGIDTPELYPTPEPYAEAAAMFANQILAMDSFGDYTVIGRFVQFEPATASTDRTDSERALAYILIEVEDNQSNKKVYTLTEMLLRAGLGIAQVGDKYIYAERLLEAYQYAIDTDSGIHPLEVEIEEPPAIPGLPVLENPELTPLVGSSIEIIYDQEEVRFKVLFKLTNPNPVSVQYYGTIGNVPFNGVLDAYAYEDFDYTVSHSVEYTISVRFYPTTIGDYNSSAWVYESLGMVSLDLDEDTINNPAEAVSAPFVITEFVKFGFHFTIGNTLGFPIHVLIRDVEAQLFNAWLQHEDSSGDVYTNTSWPLFQTHTKIITVRYQTDATMGLQRTLLIEVPVEIEGHVPIISYEGQDIDSGTASFKIINNNVYEVRTIFVLDNVAQTTFFAGPNGESHFTVDVSGFTVEKTYGVKAMFEDIEPPYSTSDYSNSLNVVIQRLTVPTLQETNALIEEIYTRVRHSNSVNADLEVYLYDMDDNLLETIEVNDLPPNTNSGVLEFENLDQTTTYRIRTRAFSTHKDYSHSVLSDATQITTGAVQVTVTFAIPYGSGVHAEVTVDQFSSIDAPTEPIREGWEFDDWLFDGTAVSFPLQVDDNMTLDGAFTQLFTVTFDTGEGGTSIDPITVRDGTIINDAPADPTREHFQFDGWEIVGEPGDVFPLAVMEDITVTAKWIPYHQVTFNTGEEGSAVDAQWILHGETASEPTTDPTREDYRFDGWDFDFSTTITEPTQIDAIWVAQVMAFFTNPYDENYEETVGPVDTGTQINQPTEVPERSGYYHVGWQTTSGTAEFPFTLTEDTNFTPIWESEPRMDTPEISVVTQGNHNITWNIKQVDEDDGVIHVRRFENGSWGSFQNKGTFEQNDSVNEVFSGLGYNEEVRIQAYVVHAGETRENSLTITATFTSIERTAKPTAQANSNIAEENEVGFIITNTDADEASVTWEIATAASGGIVRASGTVTIAGNDGTANVGTSNNISASTTYYLRSVIATADGKAASEAADVVEQTTQDPAQTSQPGTSLGTVTEGKEHHEVCFVLSNTDSTATLEWKISVGDSNNNPTGSPVRTGSFSDVPNQGTRTVREEALENDTKYVLHDVFATASGKTKSNEGTRRHMITNVGLDPIATPEVANVTPLSINKVEYTIKNVDDEAADIDWQIATAASGGTVSASGTLEDMAPNEVRTVEVSVTPNSTRHLRNVVAKTTDALGTIYRGNSTSPDALSQTSLAALPKPSISINDLSSGTNMGRAANRIRPTFSNNYKESVELHYHLVQGTASNSNYTQHTSNLGSTSISIPITEVMYGTNSGNSLQVNTQYTVRAYVKLGSYESDVETITRNTRHAIEMFATALDNDEDTAWFTLNVRNFSINSQQLYYNTDGLSPTISMGSASAFGGTRTQQIGNRTPGETVLTSAKSNLDNVVHNLSVTMTTHGTGCLSEDTPILMADGSIKLIKDVVVGDKLKAFYKSGMIHEDVEGWEEWTTENIEDAVIHETTVVGVYPDVYKAHYYFNQDLRITIQHHILVKKQSTGVWGWHTADELVIGDCFVDIDGQEVPIHRIEYIEKAIPVVKLDVEETDTYYAGRSRIVVHNDLTLPKYED